MNKKCAKTVYMERESHHNKNIEGSLVLNLLRWFGSVKQPM